MDSIGLCAAAFFRSKGKGVVTESEFLMDISMNKRWMPYGDAETLLSALLRKGLVKKGGEYIRPAFDVSAADVPAGYRPGADVLSEAKNAAGPQESRERNVFQELVAKAAAMDIDRKEFLSMCRTLQKKMNIEVEVAAVIILRDNGADVSGFIDPVYGEISER